MKTVFRVAYTPAILCAFFFISLVIGCSKSSPSNNNNNNNNNNGAVSDLVVSFSNNNSSTGATTVYSFTYDGQNRLIEEQISDGTPTISYSYGNDTVTATQGTKTTIYALNSAGQAVSDNQGNTFTYDGNGYLISETNPNGASTANTITNKNITQSVQITSTGTATTYTYTFGTNLNTLKFGITFLGSADDNLIQSEGINGVSYPFTYTYDSHGRVQTEKIVSGATTLLRTYTYVN